MANSSNNNNLDLTTLDKVLNNLSTIRSMYAEGDASAQNIYNNAAPEVQTLIDTDQSDLRFNPEAQDLYNTLNALDAEAIKEEDAAHADRSGSEIASDTLIDALKGVIDLLTFATQAVGYIPFKAAESIVDIGTKEYNTNLGLEKLQNGEITFEQFSNGDYSGQLPKSNLSSRYIQRMANSGEYIKSLLPDQSKQLNDSIKAKAKRAFAQTISNEIDYAKDKKEGKGLSADLSYIGKEFKQGLSNLAEYPSTGVSTITQQVPQFLVGGALTKLPKVAQVLFWTSQSAGDVGSNVTDILNNIDPEELYNSNQDYKDSVDNLINLGYSKEEAYKITKDELGSEMYPLARGVGALLGVVTSPLDMVASKFINNKLTKSAVTKKAAEPVIKKTSKELAEEKTKKTLKEKIKNTITPLAKVTSPMVGSGISETFEEGGGQLVSNLLEKYYIDKDKSVLQDVGRSAAEGLVGDIGGVPASIATGITSKATGKVAGAVYKGLFKESSKESKEEAERTSLAATSIHDTVQNAQKDFEQAATNTTTSGSTSSKETQERKDFLNTFKNDFNSFVTDYALDKDKEDPEFFLNKINTGLTVLNKNRNLPKEKFKEIFNLIAGSLSAASQQTTKLRNNLKDSKDKGIITQEEYDNFSKRIDDLDKNISLNKSEDLLNRISESLSTKDNIDTLISSIDEDINNNKVEDATNKINLLARVALSPNTEKTSNNVKKLKSKLFTTGQLRSVTKAIDKVISKDKLSKADLKSLNKDQKLLLAIKPLLNTVLQIKSDLDSYKDNSGKTFTTDEITHNWIFGGIDTDPEKTSAYKESYNNIKNKFKGKSKKNVQPRSYPKPLVSHIGDILTDLASGDYVKAVQDYNRLGKFLQNQYSKLEAYKELEKGNLDNAKYHRYDPVNNRWNIKPINLVNEVKDTTPENIAYTAQRSMEMIQKDTNILEKVYNDVGKVLNVSPRKFEHNRILSQSALTDSNYDFIGEAAKINSYFNDVTPPAPPASSTTTDTDIDTNKGSGIITTNTNTNTDSNITTNTITDKENDNDIDTTIDTTTNINTDTNKGNGNDKNKGKDTDDDNDTDTETSNGKDTEDTDTTKGVTTDETSFTGNEILDKEIVKIFNPQTTLTEEKLDSYYDDNIDNEEVIYKSVMDSLNKTKKENDEITDEEAQKIEESAFIKKTKSKVKPIVNLFNFLKKNKETSSAKDMLYKLFNPDVANNFYNTMKTELNTYFNNILNSPISETHLKGVFSDVNIDPKTTYKELFQKNPELAAKLITKKNSSIFAFVQYKDNDIKLNENILDATIIALVDTLASLNYKPISNNGSRKSSKDDSSLHLRLMQLSQNNKNFSRETALEISKSYAGRYLTYPIGNNILKYAGLKLSGENMSSDIALTNSQLLAQMALTALSKNASKLPFIKIFDLGKSLNNIWGDYTEVKPKVDKKTNTKEYPLTSDSLAIYIDPHKAKGISNILQNTNGNVLANRGVVVGSVKVPISISSRIRHSGKNVTGKFASMLTKVAYKQKHYFNKIMDNAVNDLGLDGIKEFLGTVDNDNYTNEYRERINGKNNSVELAFNFLNETKEEANRHVSGSGKLYKDYTEVPIRFVSDLTKVSRMNQEENSGPLNQKLTREVLAARYDIDTSDPIMQHLWKLAIIQGVGGKIYPLANDTEVNNAYDNIINNTKEIQNYLQEYLKAKEKNESVKLDGKKLNKLFSQAGIDLSFLSLHVMIELARYNNRDTSNSIFNTSVYIELDAMQCGPMSQLMLLSDPTILTNRKSLIDLARGGIFIGSDNNASVISHNNILKGDVYTSGAESVTNTINNSVDNFKNPNDKIYIKKLAADFLYVNSLTGNINIDNNISNSIIASRDSDEFNEMSLKDSTITRNWVKKPIQSGSYFAGSASISSNAIDTLIATFDKAKSEALKAKAEDINLNKEKLTDAQYFMQALGMTGLNPDQAMHELTKIKIALFELTTHRINKSKSEDSTEARIFITGTSYNKKTSELIVSNSDKEHIKFIKNTLNNFFKFDLTEQNKAVSLKGIENSITKIFNTFLGDSVKSYIRQFGGTSTKNADVLVNVTTFLALIFKVRFDKILKENSSYSNEKSKTYSDKFIRKLIKKDPVLRLLASGFIPTKAGVQIPFLKSGKLTENERNSLYEDVTQEPLPRDVSYDENQLNSRIIGSTANSTITLPGVSVVPNSIIGLSDGLTTEELTNYKSNKVPENYITEKVFTVFDGHDTRLTDITTIGSIYNQVNMNNWMNVNLFKDVDAFLSKVLNNPEVQAMLKADDNKLFSELEQAIIDIYNQTEAPTKYERAKAAYKVANPNKSFDKTVEDYYLANLDKLPEPLDVSSAYGSLSQFLEKREKDQSLLDFLDDTAKDVKNTAKQIEFKQKLFKNIPISVDHYSGAQQAYKHNAEDALAFPEDPETGFKLIEEYASSQIKEFYKDNSYNPIPYNTWLEQHNKVLNTKPEKVTTTTYSGEALTQLLKKVYTTADKKLYKNTGINIGAIFKKGSNLLKDTKIIVYNNKDEYNKALAKIGYDKTDTTGIYNPSDNIIYTYATNGNIDNTTIMHEVLHAMLAKQINDHLKGNLDPKSDISIAVSNLVKLRDAILKGTLETDNIPALNQLKQIIESKVFSLDQILEMVSYVLTEPVFANNSIKGLKRNKLKSSALIRNIYDTVKRNVKKLFGLEKDFSNELNFYQQVFVNTLAIVYPKEETQNNADTETPIMKPLARNNIFNNINNSVNRELLNNAVESIFSKLNSKENIVKIYIEREKFNVNFEYNENLFNLEKSGFKFEPDERYAFSVINAILDSNLLTNSLNSSAKSDLFNLHKKIITKDILDNLNLSNNQKEFLKNNNSAAVILALTTTNKDFRDKLDNALKNTKKDKKESLSSLDNLLINAFNSIVDKLDTLTTGSKDLANVKNLMNDLLTTDINESLKDNITNVYNIPNKVESYIRDFSIRSVQKVPYLGKFIEDPKNQLEYYKDFILTLTYKSTKIPEIVKSIIRDIIGRTKSTDWFYTILKKSKQIQRERDIYLTRTPEAILSTFKHKPSKEQLDSYTKSILKADLQCLSDFSSKKMKSILADKTKLNNEITALMDRISKIKSSSFNPISKQNLAKLDEMTSGLAEYLATGKSRYSLLHRNAYSMAYELNTDPNTIRLIDQVISLKTLQYLDADTYQDLVDLINNEPEAYDYILNLVHNINTKMGAKATKVANIITAGSIGPDFYSSPNAAMLLNTTKGYIPYKTRSTTKLILVPNNTDISKYLKLGYKEIKKTSKGTYLTSNISNNTTYLQGALQIITPTYNGVNLYSGNPINKLSRIKYNDPNFNQLVFNDITKSKLNKTTTEVEFPIYDYQQVNMGNNVIDTVFEPVNTELMYDTSVVDTLPRETQIQDIIATILGRNIEESLAYDFNKRFIEEMYNMYEKDPEKDNYIDILHSNDPVIKDAVKRIKDILPENRRKSFYVRRDLVDNFLGERLASIGNFWEGPSRFSENTKKAVRDILQAILGKNAYNILTKGENILFGTASFVRNYIVIRSIVVPAINIISNIAQLNARGVPITYIVKSIPNQLKQINTYIKLQNDYVKLNLTKMGYDKNSKEYDRLIKRVNYIDNNIKQLGIYELISRGEFSTIADQGLTVEDLNLTSGKLGETIEKLVDKLPSGVKELGRYGIITKSTPLYMFLERSVQYGDFIAKAIYLDYLQNRPHNPLSKQEAGRKVAEEFIDYDPLAGRTRTYIEAIGAGWFFNYSIRSVKIGLSMLVNNPIHSILTLLCLNNPLGSPITDNLISKTLDGTILNSVGPFSLIDMMLNAIMLNPIAALLL